jgi:hypothetical protein
LMLPHDPLRVYALKGRSTSLLWCRDPRNTWQTELAEGKPPEWVKGVTLNIRELLPAGKVSLQLYDPWQNQWSAGEAPKDGSILLPDFRRSLVVRITRR